MRNVLNLPTKGQPKLEYKVQRIYYGNVIRQWQLAQACFHQPVYSNIRHDHVAYHPSGSTVSHLSSTPDPGHKDVWEFHKIHVTSKRMAKTHVIKWQFRARDDAKPDPVAMAEGMLMNSKDVAWIDFAEHELVMRKCFELSDSFALTRI